jgi:CBS domain-containing protein
MPQAFDADNPPFDRLDHQQIGELRAALDIGYFRPGETIIERGQRSGDLHVVIKGSVEERDGDVIEALLGPQDSFDARSLVHGAAGARFVAAEETLCYLVPKAVILDLIGRNLGFAAFFYSEISHKLASFARRQETEGVDSVLRARVRDVRYHPAVFVDGSATIEEAGRVMHERDNNALFVREDGGGRIGVVTGMNLSKAAVLQRLPLETSVRDVCHFDVVSVDVDDFIFAAIIAMTRHNKRRLAIKSNGAYIGMIEDIDILGLVAGNSQLIPGRIDRGRDLDDLAGAAADIQNQVERLERQGVRVEAIAEITSDLNRRLIAKLFDMIAPPSIREAGCLMVMGSEGRGEQTVRTDQDNGLLLTHAVAEDELQAFRDAFTGALERFGFPQCSGNVMVRNPQWSQPIDDFIRQLKGWVLTPVDDSAMNLGIFFDAVAAGADRAELVERARSALIEMMRGESAYLAHFAHAIDQFEGASAGMLSSLMASVGVGSAEIDIKKSGTFPIVHGIRTLAIEQGIKVVPTVRRIEALVTSGVLGEDLGRELAGALSYFMEIRLRSQLRAMKTGRRETEAIVRLSELSTRDRDLLRDALRVVKRFREVIRNRYHLGMF